MTFVKTFETKQDQKFPKMTVFLGSILGILVLLEIWVSHTVVASGMRLSDIQNLQEAKRRENAQLQNQIASVSALVNVASGAASLGLGSAKNIQYIH